MFLLERKQMQKAVLLMYKRLQKYNDLKLAVKSK